MRKPIHVVSFYLVILLIGIVLSLISKVYYGSDYKVLMIYMLIVCNIELYIEFRSIKDNIIFSTICIAFYVVYSLI